MAKVYLEDSELTNIGNAIRGKNGETTKYLPSEMPAAIDAIKSGGAELITVSGPVSYICGYPGYYTSNWLSEHFTSAVNPKWGPITDPEGMCYYMSNLDKISEINIEPDLTSRSPLNDTFRDATGKIPILKGKANFGTRAFSSRYLEELPLECFAQLDAYMFDMANTSCAYMFQNCYVLKDISGFKEFCMRTKMQTNSYAAMYSGCRKLKEVIMPPFWKDDISKTNYVNSCWTNCSSIENIIWVADEIYGSGSTTLVWNLKSSNGAGMWSSAPTTGLQSYGIGTPETEVTDLDSYNRLKDTEYWWTQNVNFSHLNHDNVLQIIKNLPRARSKMTLTLTGAMGSGYGKAISNLTDAEIAIGTDKGWTISIS